MKITDNPVPRKDIILFNGTKKLRIAVIMQMLTEYFDDHDFVSCSCFVKHDNMFEVIDLYIATNGKLIANGPEYHDSPSIFKVLVTDPKEIKKLNREFLSQQYDQVFELGKIVPDKKTGKRALTSEDIASAVVVAWGCWLDGRKVTCPL
jgi:hypothetical protein